MTLIISTEESAMQKENLDVKIIIEYDYLHLSRW